jgi:nitrate reductase gamma subunit
MTVDELLFGVLPYIVIVLAITVTILRWRFGPFSVSSLSSQLLESRQLYWGSVSFHWGLSLILLAHLAALIVPQGFEAWNGAPLRLYLLEITGLALALWAAFGLTVLIHRRLTNHRIRRVTSKMDLVVLATIAVQIITGIWIAVGYRWGSYWGTAIFVPYIRGILTLQPDPALVAPLPLVLKLHVLAFFAFLALFPFTRLVHIITLPLQYFFRPWQRVVAMRWTPSGRYQPTGPVGAAPPSEGRRPERVAP